MKIWQSQTPLARAAIRVDSCSVALPTGGALLLIIRLLHPFASKRRYLLILLIESLSARTGTQLVVPEIHSFAFYGSLLMSFGWGTKLAVKSSNAIGKR